MRKTYKKICDGTTTKSKICDTFRGWLLLSGTTSHSEGPANSGGRQKHPHVGIDVVWASPTMLVQEMGHWVVPERR